MFAQLGLGGENEDGLELLQSKAISEKKPQLPVALQIKQESCFLRSPDSAVPALQNVLRCLRGKNLQASLLIPQYRRLQ